MAWLLDPNGSHELGDRFARRFFARAGITFGGRVFDFGTPLDLVVVEEFSWQVPSEAKVFGDEPTRSLRCDLLAVLGRDVVPIELKVDSYESAYDVDGGRWAQAALYTAVMEAVCHPRRVDHGMAWRQCVRASAYSTEVGRGTILWSRLERCQCARGIIVHMAEGCLKQHEGAGVENRRDVRHIEWIDAVAILADLRAQRGFALDVDHLTLAFGQAVLERIPVGEYTIMEATEELRMRCAERLLLTRFPVRTVVEVERLRRALSARASCHVKWDTRFNGGLSSAR